MYERWNRAGARRAAKKGEKYKKEYLAAGMTEKTADSKAEKKAIEDARSVLPNACETKMV